MSELTPITTLNDCAQGFLTAVAETQKLFRKATYRAVAGGVWLLKARELYARPAHLNQARKGGKFTVTDTVADTAGFEAWVATQTNNLPISLRTAYRWMNAAQNAGLTASSTEDDVRALEEQGTLDDVPLAKLYASPQAALTHSEGDAAGADSGHEPDPLTVQKLKAQQLWFNFYREVAQCATDEDEIQLLYHLPLTAEDPSAEVGLSELEVQLEAALEKVRIAKAERLAAAKSRKR